MMGPDPKLPENPLAISWHDSNWIPILTPHNVMDYFSEKSNPFYDRTCNNEVLKMQRASPDQLPNMVGTEFVLLHVQDPILYVIRKQHRQGPQQVVPLADYYIVAGTVYQAPDLGSVLNSRLISTATHLQSAFDEARQYARYHPSKGYWWDFEKKQTLGGRRPGAMVPLPAASAPSDDDANAKAKKKRPSRKKEVERKAREEPSSIFQRRKVDALLELLTQKFPPKTPPAAAAGASMPGSSAATAAQGGESAAASVKDESGSVKGGDKASAADVKAEKEAPSSSASSLAGGVKREAPSAAASSAPAAKKMKGL